MAPISRSPPPTHSFSATTPPPPPPLQPDALPQSLPTTQRKRPRQRKPSKQVLPPSQSCPSNSMSTPASLTAAAEPLTSGGDMERSPFLSPPPRSGQLSPHAQKIAAEVVIWLASIVVFGSTANHATVTDRCGPLCRYDIATGAISCFVTTFILGGHCLTWTSRVSKTAWMSSSAERNYMRGLVVWWTVGVSTLSAYKGVDLIKPALHTSHLAIAFGWLAFFSSIFGAYKAYHAEKEEEKILIYQQALSMQQAEEEEEFANFS